MTNLGVWSLAAALAAEAPPAAKNAVANYAESLNTENRQMHSAPSHNFFCTHENSNPFLHRDLTAAHDVHAYGMYANEVHAHNVHTRDTRL
jgi:hypothetical protein